MKFLLIPLIGMAVILIHDAATAQQAPSPVPFTEWRIGLDSDLSKLSMPREAHMAIYNILQLYERQAQMEKMRQPPPKAVEEKK